MRRGAPLQIQHAWLWPLFKVSLGPAPGAPESAGLQAQADRVLAEAAAVASSVAPELVVETSLVTGEAASRLVEASRDAALLVLGHRGLGGFTGLLLGSVGISAASHAFSPVVVVRGRADAGGPVVVGVDGPSAQTPPVVDLAFATARCMGAQVVAVYSYVLTPRHRGFADRVAETSGPVRDYRHHLLGVEDDARRMVEEELAGARARYPDVDVTVRLSESPPARELVTASGRARLVVVGARGSGGLAARVLGSTSHALIHHADCPVMVAR